MIFNQLWKMLWRIETLQWSLYLLGEARTPTCAFLIPTTDTVRAQGWVFCHLSQNSLQIYHHSLSQAFKFHPWTQHSHMRLGLWYKPSPGKWVERRRLHLHRLALVLLPDLQLMLHKRVISMTQFADRLPRGHDLSELLAPSSPDVLDPFEMPSQKPWKAAVFS